MKSVVTAAIVSPLLPPCAAFAQERKAAGTRGPARAANAAAVRATTALIRNDTMRVVESIRTLGYDLRRPATDFSDDPSPRIDDEHVNQLSEDVETAGDARVEAK